MREFSQDAVGKHVVDVHGVDVGRISSIEDGYARLSPETGVASRMEAALSPPDVDGPAVAPEQVEEVTDEYVRVDVDLGE